jgi:hypothetical protein
MSNLYQKGICGLPPIHPIVELWQETGGLPVTAGNAELRPIAAIPVTRYRYRGTQIPGPWMTEPA